MNGDGKSYGAFYRVLDTRLGRWLSIDPKHNLLPDQDPFAFANGSPIVGNDPNGDDCIPCIGAIIGAAIGISSALYDVSQMKGGLSTLNPISSNFNVKSVAYLYAGYAGVAFIGMGYGGLGGQLMIAVTQNVVQQKLATNKVDMTQVGLAAGLTLAGWGAGKGLERLLRPSMTKSISGAVTRYTFPQNNIAPNLAAVAGPGIGLSVGEKVAGPNLPKGYLLWDAESNTSRPEISLTPENRYWDQNAPHMVEYAYFDEENLLFSHVKQFYGEGGDKLNENSWFSTVDNDPQAIKDVRDVVDRVNFRLNGQSGIIQDASKQ